jgi:ABC-2 type transport system ATP-binding protein
VASWCSPGSPSAGAGARNPDRPTAAALTATADPAAGARGTDPDPLVRIEGLTKTYPGGVRAIDGLDVTLTPGAIGLVGANGAGKSTLFRILLGLTRPDAGSVEVAGIDVASDPVGVRSELGFMPEHECLPTDQTAADVVATLGEVAGLPPRDARQRASDVLDLVGLDEARFRPIEGFSTGMRQRTKLAQALVADPALVLLDEPTAGLDPAGRHEMLDLVRRLSRFGISVVMATHLLDDVQNTCDQVVMIDAGRLVASGRTDELMETTGLVRIDVGGHGDRLMAVLGPGATLLPDGAVEIAVHGDDALDALVATVAEARLPLHALSSRRATLDGLFAPAAATRPGP